MAKRDWGTITKPEGMELGYQKVEEEEVERIVDRLYKPDWQKKYEPKVPTKRPLSKMEKKEMNEDEIDDMVTRLTRKAEQKVPDRKRTGAMEQQGICNTYMWKGWDYYT